MILFIWNHGAMIWGKGNRRTARYGQAFSLFEAVASIAVLGVLTAVCVSFVVSPNETAGQMKLEQDVRILNSAVGVYLVFGGSLDGVATVQEVIDKLKTRADAVSVEKGAGLTGSFVDKRLIAVMQSDEEAGESTPRVYWDSATSRFTVTYSGSPGVKEFVFDDVAAATAGGTEARGHIMNLSLVDGWIWDYTDLPTGSATTSPTTVSTVPDSGNAPVSAIPPAVDPGQLLPPIYSQESGTFSITDFDLALYLSDPNPVGRGKIVYSVDSSVWTDYTGVPVDVPPGVEVKAYVESVDPAFSDSVEVMHAYAASPAKLAMPLISASATAFDFGDNQTIVVTLNNPNDAAISELEYRKNGGAWQAYSAPFTLNVLNDSSGAEIEARAVATSPNWITSEISALLIDGATGVRLEAPIISFDHIGFGDGKDRDDEIRVTISNPNPSGSSEIYYQIVPVSVYFSTAFMPYTGYFKVKEEDYPMGFAIRAYAKSSAAPYTDSDYAFKSTGSHFGDDVNAGGLAGSFYDLNWFATGYQTYIDDDTKDEFNQTFYNVLKQITPEVSAGSWGFDPSELRKFWHEGKTAFATRFSSPTMDHDAAHEAFVDYQVEENWIVHYSGAIQPGNAGWYRFSGRANDVLQVWIDGRLVLSATKYPWEVTEDFPWTEKPDWEAYLATNPDKPHKDASDDIIESPVAGPWIYLDGTHEIDVIVGEQEKDDFYMNLRVEEQGVTYADGPQVFTTIPLTAEDAVEVSDSFPASAPGTSDPPVFYVVE